MTFKILRMKTIYADFLDSLPRKKSSLQGERDETEEQFGLFWAVSQLGTSALLMGVKL